MSSAKRQKNAKRLRNCFKLRKFFFVPQYIIVLLSAEIFAILLIIIGITTLVFKITGLFDLKKELDAAKKASQGEVAPASTQEVTIKDDDMMAAVLVATIDYRLTHKSDVRVVSVKEIK